MLTPNDAELFAAHLEIADAESGQNGEPHFHPYSAAIPFDAVAQAEKERRRWQIPITTVGWRRAWGLFVDDGMVGHICVDVAPLESALHRVSFGMGIMSGFRRQGAGRLLLETIIGWTQAQPSIDWIDLGVFVENLGAQRLYTSMGFEERGRTLDCFRVDGHRIDDIQMVYWVGPHGQKPRW